MAKVCEGTTTKGKRCTRLTWDGEKRCAYHRRPQRWAITLKFEVVTDGDFRGVFKMTDGWTAAACAAAFRAYAAKIQPLFRGSFEVLPGALHSIRRLDDG